MKELSIEEKAKAYDEAIEKAKDYYHLGDDKHIMAIDAKAVMEYIFPELKESEDLKIKSDIQFAVRCAYGDNSSKTESILAWLEKQDNIDKAYYEIAEKEKYDYVSGKFIECRKSFNEFKEDTSYWFEYIGNDTYIGRSDNILNKKFHITPRQLYRLFTQEHYYPKENNVNEEANAPTGYGKYLDEQKKQIHFPKFTFDDVLALQCCMETVKKVQEDKELYERLNIIHNKMYDAYWLEKQISQDNAEDVDILHRFSFYSYKDEPNVLYLSGIYVNEEYRNKGIGTKILEVADEVAKSLNCHAIRLKTKKDSDAERLYRTHAYNSLATEDKDEIWLEKQGEQNLNPCDGCINRKGCINCENGELREV